MAIDYQERIPNNVDLASDRSLQRALEHWQPEFINWWKGMGPTDFQQADVYLRTAISVDQNGWASYGHVQMPDYRWGIFLAERDENKTIGFGDEHVAHTISSDGLTCSWGGPNKDGGQIEMTNLIFNLLGGVGAAPGCRKRFPTARGCQDLKKS